MKNSRHAEMAFQYWKAIKEGKRVKWAIAKKTGSLNWFSSEEISPAFCDHFDYVIEVLENTITIGSWQVPEPLRREPPEGVIVFCSDPTVLDLYWPFCWESRFPYQNLLKKGILHLKKENAVVHSKALISLTEKKT